MVRIFALTNSLAKLKPLPGYSFPATARKIANIHALFPPQLIRQEPSLFGASLLFAARYGGPITQKILHDLLPLIPSQGNHRIVIDTRTHDLRVGEIPAIPGWHTDFVERTPASGMEPDYCKITPSVNIYIINASSCHDGVSSTEYLTQSISLDIPSSQVNTRLDEQLSSMTTLQTEKAVDGDILRMDQLSLHRATPAHTAGMHYLLRVAVLHNLATTILASSYQNEVRMQSHSKRATVSKRRKICDRPELPDLSTLV